MIFRHPDEGSVELPLVPRSMLILTKEARYLWTYTTHLYLKVIKVILSFSDMALTLERRIILKTQLWSEEQGYH